MKIRSELTTSTSRDNANVYRARAGRLSIQKTPDRVLRYNILLGGEVNRECNGDFFDAMVGDERRRLYRCFGNGFVMTRGQLNNGDQCPECSREIDARFVGLVETRKNIVAMLPLWSMHNPVEITITSEVVCESST
ncbi:hypothetical protein Poly59_31080 [Rubripirellula reticaptiva]|uniref:Uncharacterized protein n=1 Tax=Rubripirellula reticaptiva TaxID=2528013 RepID=A0A5C6EV55_9BACT|nr:hypothetical protein Poly59_31080 [Rubripirellula reticaptiva]